MAGRGETCSTGGFRLALRAKARASCEVHVPVRSLRESFARWTAGSSETPALSIAKSPAAAAAANMWREEALQMAVCVHESLPACAFGMARARPISIIENTDLWQGKLMNLWGQAHACHAGRGTEVALGGQRLLRQTAISLHCYRPI